MAKQLKKQIARKSPKPLADTKRVRFGAGTAPAIVSRQANPDIRDDRMVRFGAGTISARLVK